MTNSWFYLKIIFINRQLRKCFYEELFSLRDIADDINLGGQNTAPKASLREIKNPAPKASLREIQNTAPKASLREIQNTAPKASLREIKNTAPKVSLREIQNKDTGF